MFYFLQKDRASVREMLLEMISAGEEHPGTQGAAQHPHCRQGPLFPLSPAQEQIKALGIYLLAGCRTLALSDGAFHPY